MEPIAIFKGLCHLSGEIVSAWTIDFFFFFLVVLYMDLVVFHLPTWRWVFNPTQAIVVLIFILGRLWRIEQNKIIAKHPCHLLKRKESKRREICPAITGWQAFDWNYHCFVYSFPKLCKITVVNPICRWSQLGWRTLKSNSLGLQFQLDVEANLSFDMYLSFLIFIMAIFTVSTSS